MEVPTQISFRGVESSAAIEAKVRERVARLERYYDRIIGCRVMIEAPHRRHQHGTIYHVRVDVVVPGGELVVNREPAEHHQHEDLYVAIRDAFDAAQRRLEDHARRQRGAVKAHEARPGGVVAQLFVSEGYGFIESMDGRELYFHRNSVLDDAFDRLAIGSRVEFVDEPGEQGTQASTVRLIGHPAS
jgi:ribosomal subunit interface protein